MEKHNKPKDFTLAGFINKGTNLVMDRKQEKFYLVDETEYDSAGNEDEIQCELLNPIENDKDIKFFRHEPTLNVQLKRGELQSVLLQS